MTHVHANRTLKSIRGNEYSYNLEFDIDELGNVSSVIEDGDALKANIKPRIYDWIVLMWQVYKSLGIVIKKDEFLNCKFIFEEARHSTLIYILAGDKNYCISRSVGAEWLENVSKPHLKSIIFFIKNCRKYKKEDIFLHAYAIKRNSRQIVVNYAYSEDKKHFSKMITDFLNKYVNVKFNSWSLNID